MVGKKRRKSVKLVRSVKSVPYDDERLARIIIIAAVIINFMLLIPLFQGWCLVSGDGTAHYAAAQAVKFRLEADKGFFGNWNQLWVMGFPAYSYYQYFAHIFMVILNYLSFGLLPILVIEKLLIVMAVTFFPLSIYYGLRKLKLASLPAAFASLFAFALSSSVGHGDLGFSLVNHGLFTQLLAVFLFPIALARVYVTLSERRSYFLSVLFFSLVLLVHPIVGYALGISCLVLFFDGRSFTSSREFFRRAACLLVVFAFVFVVVSHFYVPFLREGAYYGSTFYTTTADYYQNSMPQVLFDFFSGRTLDLFRFPFAILTLFFFIGVYAAVARRLKCDFPLGIAIAGLVFFLSISFGRSFWGVLFDIIPGTGYMLVFRLMFALQFFALFFIGAGFAFLYRGLSRLFLLRRDRRVPIFVLCIILVLIALPVFMQVLLTNRELCRFSNSGFDSGSFSRLVLFLRGAPDGRFIARPELGFQQPYYESLLPVYTAHDSFGSSSIGSQDNLAFYYTQYFMLPSQHFFNLYNIRYALMPSDRPPEQHFFEQVFVAGNYTLYSIPTTGFFDLVDSSTALMYSGSMHSDFVRSVNRAWLNTYAMENKDFVTILHEAEALDAEEYHWVIDEEDNHFTEAEMKARFKDHDRPVLPSCGEVFNENRTLNTYVASVLTNRSCLLLFKMSYHPGWHAVVNGAAQDVLAVSPGFMAVRVGSGFSDAEFDYHEDMGFRHWLIAFAVLVLLGLAMYDWGSGSVRGRA
ncbi:hypothetical protein JW898_02915 [Candidatus Woesearchaeota archaeon]|nr:hypothetical protein [Candidatus Woesearchaeota archaeon]